MRKKYTEVTCNNCKALIGCYTKYPAENAIKDGAVVNKLGDFCHAECFEQYKSYLVIEEPKKCQ
jgi:hypothetical protein